MDMVHVQPIGAVCWDVATCGPMFFHHLRAMGVARARKCAEQCIIIACTFQRRVQLVCNDTDRMHGPHMERPVGHGVCVCGGGHGAQRSQLVTTGWAGGKHRGLGGGAWIAAAASHSCAWRGCALNRSPPSGRTFPLPPTPAGDKAVLHRTRHFPTCTHSPVRLGGGARATTLADRRPQHSSSMCLLRL